tara:strand:+ start:1879 stop:2487 length:609 start_codon:yes stop_codon:yes gene_type:complete
MRKSRLSKEKQARLMENFVAGTTARCAANLVGVNCLAAYFYRRLREVITPDAENETLLSSEFEVNESCFGGIRKGKLGRCAVGKVPVFGILKRGGRVYKQSFEMLPARPCFQSFEIKYSLTASSILIAGAATMCWIFPSLSTIGLTIQNYLQTSTITSTESRISGTRPKGTCGNLMVFLSSNFRYFKKSANGDLINLIQKHN